MGMKFFSQNRKMLFLLMVSTVPSAFLFGCNQEDEEGGSLQLSYQLGSGKSCEELDIENVIAVLNDDKYDEDVSCDKEEIRFNDVEPGTYTLQLFGYNSDGKAVMDSEPQTSIKIESGTTLELEDTIRLVSSPAKIKLRWDFQFSDCDKSGLGGFMITAFTADGSGILLEQDIGCDFNSVDDKGYHTIPDEERELKGDDFGEVEIQPYDSNDTALGDPIIFSIDESPGAGGVVMLSLECDDTGCTGSGEPD